MLDVDTPQATLVSSDEANHQIASFTIDDPWCGAATLKRLYVYSDVGAAEDAPRNSSQTTAICFVKKSICYLFKRFAGIQLGIHRFDLVGVCELVCIHLTSFVFTVNPRMGERDVFCLARSDL